LISLAAATTALAGCGAASVTADHTNTAFSISPESANLDTNCTGCNVRNARGVAAHRFSAKFAVGNAMPLRWSVAGGDPGAGAGTITADGEYTPPNFLTRSAAKVLVTARLAADSKVAASAQVNVTPGFSQALVPENAALGANGTVTFTGRLAEAGGDSELHFALANSESGTGGGVGTLGPVNCQHSKQAFTSCTVTYTAPQTIAGTGVTYLVATAGNSPARTAAEILLNTAGVTSNPASHQAQLQTFMSLGSSGGNNHDFDARGNTIADCCSGTLGALIQDNNGKQFILSNNHVLARSDHASVGDAIVQPGLIDNNCTPNGDGPGTVPVASLSAWLPLRSPQTNADAAIAQVASRTVDATGSILELGTRQSDGTLAAAPPGISTSGGKGEAAGLQMKVAKSGRTTGLTCASVSALSLDVSVDYYRDCAETKPYISKLFSNQIAISGDRLSDAGDSGALLEDSVDAEPVGLFFAGGTDASGVGQGVANPATEVLSELGSLSGGATNYTFVGGTDHAVSCLNYGDSTVSAAQAVSLSDAEIARAQRALYAARLMVNPTAGILAVSMGKSSDHPGEAAVIIYVDESGITSIPSTLEGVRTLVIPATAHTVALGTAPLANASSSTPAFTGASLSLAMNVKNKFAHGLMRQNSAFFGIGVGQSLDNPREAALVIYMDRNKIPAHLPQSVGTLRTRYVVMDRLHVTRSYATKIQSARHCVPHAMEAGRDTFDPARVVQPLKLF
jgi:hypothetical protein